MPPNPDRGHDLRGRPRDAGRPCVRVRVPAGPRQPVPGRGAAVSTAAPLHAGRSWTTRVTRLAPARTAGRSVALASAIVLSWAASARAQRTTGELSGTVVDALGGRRARGRRGPRPRGLARHAPDGRRTRSGFFAFAAIPAGTYTLTVTMPGFRTHEVTGIELLGRRQPDGAHDPPGGGGPWPSVVSVTADVALEPLNSGEKTATLTGERDPDDARGGHERGRGPAGPPRHDSAHAGQRHQPPLVHRGGLRHQRQRRVPGRPDPTTRARSGASSPTGPARAPSTSPSTGPPATTPGATARPR